MKRIIPVLFALSVFGSAFGQKADTLSIEECFRIASDRSPLTRQKSNYEESLSHKIKNLNNNWFPSVGFNAQATYNSETVDFSDFMGDLPVSMPSLPLDQYKIWADINQQLYDGGMIKAQKAVEIAGYEADIQQVESELLVVKQQVNQVYFSLLVNKKSSDILQLSLDELLERKKVIKAGVDNGVVLQENMLALEAEELRMQQRLLELELNQDRLFKILSILMDSTLTGNLVIADPVEMDGMDESVNRPEYVMFDKQKERLLAGQRLVTASDMPLFFAFSQAAYGRPGYNFVSTEFHPFYMVGVGMKWNFLHYGDSRRQKKILDIQKDMIEIKRETFNDQLNIQLQTENTNMVKYNELLSRDEQILKLRKAITATSLFKLTSGIITSTDYLTDLNAEILARLQYENHKILRVQAIYSYMLLQGKL